MKLHEEYQSVSLGSNLKSELQDISSKDHSFDLIDKDHCNSKTKGILIDGLVSCQENVPGCSKLCNRVSQG